MGWTLTKLDNMGRAVQTETYGGAALPSGWPSGSNSNVTGRTTAAYDTSVTGTVVDGRKTVTTESAATAVSRTSYTDALGRLSKVVESTDGSDYTTTYTWDALNNLSGVCQKGAGGACQRSRTFVYSSLGRLSSADNPESGLTSFLYDGNGNLTSKTDARPSTVSMEYDEQNRLVTKKYDGTLFASYCYDGDNSTHTGPVRDCTGAPGTGTNLKGRLTWVNSTAGSTSYKDYDALGRVLSSEQKIDGTPYPFAYVYNRAGGLKSITYPSGRTVTTTFNEGNRPKKVESGTTVYASSLTYAPHGGLSEWRRTYTDTSTYDVVETTSYNSRLQVSGITLLKNTTQQLGLQFFYCAGQAASCLTNNANVMGQKITIPEAATPWNWSYGYDGMNRLTSAEESGTNAVKQYYGHDAWGNRAVESTSTYMPDPGITPQAVAGSGTVPFNANNQWAGASYDTAGFQLTNFGTLQTPNNAQYTYDAEGRLETAVVPERGTIRYTYDGEGRRVKSQVGTAQTVYVYDAAGQLAAEYGGSVAGSGTQYLTADHLGSTRLVTDAAGAMVRRSDYLPYGEEIAVPGNGTAGPGGRTLAMGYRASDALDQADVVSQKFTGQLRDWETGLDYFGARYFSGAMGRFTSADPLLASGHAENPQSWNRYAYTYSNPLKYVDHNGKWPTEIHKQIIANAFPGLSNVQLANLKGTSAYVDRLENQTRAGNHDHAMRSPGEDSVAAENAIDSVISSHESKARALQGGLAPEHAYQIDPGALNEFGTGLHTVMDRTSPTHTGPDGKPMVGSGIPMSKREIRDMQRHLAGENSISPAQMQKAVQAAQESFRRTFGNAALAEAVRDRKKKEEDLKQH